MRLLPIRYTDDVDAAVRFYRALGLAAGPKSRPGTWVELPAVGGSLAIHHAGPDERGRCELAFQSDEPLTAVADRLRAAGFEPGPVLDENFGHSLRVRDPDGVWVQINHHDRDLYT